MARGHDSSVLGARRVIGRSFGGWRIKRRGGTARTFTREKASRTELFIRGEIIRQRFEETRTESRTAKSRSDFCPARDLSDA